MDTRNFYFLNYSKIKDKILYEGEHAVDFNADILHPAFWHSDTFAKISFANISDIFYFCSIFVGRAR